MSWKPARPEIEDTGLLTEDGDKLLRVKRDAKVRLGFDIYVLRPKERPEPDVFDAFYCPESALDHVLGEATDYDPGGDPPSGENEVEDDDVCGAHEEDGGGYWCWSDDVDFPPGDYDTNGPHPDYDDEDEDEDE